MMTLSDFLAVTGISSLAAVEVSEHLPIKDHTWIGSFTGSDVAWILAIVLVIMSILLRRRELKSINLTIQLQEHQMSGIERRRAEE
jgi:hypothetical protein